MRQLKNSLCRVDFTFSAIFDFLQHYGGESLIHEDKSIIQVLEDALYNFFTSFALKSFLCIQLKLFPPPCPSLLSNNMFLYHLLYVEIYKVVRWLKCVQNINRNHEILFPFIFSSFSSVCSFHELGTDVYFFCCCDQHSNAYKKSFFFQFSNSLKNKAF